MRHSKKFFVPFPSDAIKKKKEQQFGLCKQKEYYKILKRLDGLFVPIFENTLMDCASFVIFLPVVNYANKCIIQLVTKQEFQNLKATSAEFKLITTGIDQISIGKLGMKVGPFHTMPGLTVSVWSSMKEGHPG